jgi:GT2 family glycosyltransferase
MSSKKIIFSIIIVYYNRFDLLISFLKKIYISSNKIEFLLLVNQKKDFNFFLIKKFFPNLVIIYSQKNLGFAAGCNLLAKKAKGLSLFFLNYDADLNKAKFKTLIYDFEEKIDRSPNSIFGLMAKKNKKITIHNREVYTADILGFPGTSKNKKKLFYLEGSFLIMRKIIFEKLGLFDDKFFMYVDDIDFSWRAQIFGYNLVLIDNFDYIHFSGQSSELPSRLTGKKKYIISLDRRYGVEAYTLRMLIKNYHYLSLLFIFPLIVVSYIFQIVFFSIILRFPYTKILLHSIYWNIINIKSTLKLRKKIQSQRKRSDFYIFNKMDIIPNIIKYLFKFGIPKMKFENHDKKN